MTETLTEPPPLPARRFKISKASVARNERIFLCLLPVAIVVYLSLMALFIPLGPSRRLETVLFVSNILGFFMMLFLARRSIRATLAQISYAVDRGFLTTYIGDRRSWLRIDLSKITGAVVGDVARTGERRMQLTTRRGWILDLFNTEDMEDFVAAVGYYVPVEIERRREALSIWTKQSITALAICSLFLVLIFVGFGYTLAQFF